MQEETPIKNCEYCRSKGFYLLHFDFLIEGKIYSLPRYTSCEYCGGLGYKEKTDFEIELEIENNKFGNDEKY